MTDVIASRQRLPSNKIMFPASYSMSRIAMNDGLIEGEDGDAFRLETDRRSGRKRAASIDVEEANHPKMRDLSLETSGVPAPLNSSTLKESICICTPAPKVPRPRNGKCTFISISFANHTLMLWKGVPKLPTVRYSKHSGCFAFFVESSKGTSRRVKVEK
jgi:hypothetical protein